MEVDEDFVNEIVELAARSACRELKIPCKRADLIKYRKLFRRMLAIVREYETTRRKFEYRRTR